MDSSIIWWKKAKDCVSLSIGNRQKNVMVSYYCPIINVITMDEYSRLF